jgi:hypothetical protein
MFQGLIAEDGQLYVIDPQCVDLHSSSRRNSTQLNALQGVKQNILKHHKRFTDKTLNHIKFCVLTLPLLHLEFFVQLNRGA